MSSNLSPAERGFQVRPGVFPLWKKKTLAGFPAGKWHPTFRRLKDPMERSYKSQRFTQVQLRRFVVFCVCVRVEGGIHLPLALVFFRSSGGLDVFFRRGVIALREKPNYVSTLAVESDEFKGNRAHLRPAQWLKDIKQTERRDQY